MASERSGASEYGRWPVVVVVNAAIYASLGRELVTVAFGPSPLIEADNQLPLPTVRDLLLTLLVLIAWSHASIALHEVGHVLAARIVGCRVSRIEIGRGRVLLRTHWTGAALTLGAVPSGGLTAHSQPTTSRRRALIAAAGPAMDGLMTLLSAIVVVAIVRRAHAAPPGSVSPSGAVAMAAEVALVVSVHHLAHLIGNLTPRQLPGGQWTDGALLAAIRRGDPIDRRPATVTWGAAWREAVQRSDAGDPSAALHVLAAWPHERADDRELQVWHSTLAFHLGRAGRLDEAIEQYGLALASGAAGEVIPYLEHARLDALVSRALLRGPVACDPPEAWLRARLGEIEAEVAPHVTHTASLLCLLLGEPSRAAALAIEAARASGLAAVDRAIVQATVAMALAAAGDLAQARQWYDDVPAWSPWHAAAGSWVRRGGRPASAELRTTGA